MRREEPAVHGADDGSVRDAVVVDPVDPEKTPHLLDVARRVDAPDMLEKGRGGIAGRPQPRVEDVELLRQLPGIGGEDAVGGRRGLRGDGPAGNGLRAADAARVNTDDVVVAPDLRAQPGREGCQALDRGETGPAGVVEDRSLGRPAGRGDPSHPHGSAPGRGIRVVQGDGDDRALDALITLARGARAPVERTWGSALGRCIRATRISRRRNREGREHDDRHHHHRQALDASRHVHKTLTRSALAGQGAIHRRRGQGARHPHAPLQQPTNPPSNNRHEPRSSS